jgi:hypothetical protein
MRSSAETLHGRLEPGEERAGKLLAEGVRPDLTNILPVSRTEHGFIGCDGAHFDGQVDVIIILLNDPSRQAHRLGCFLNGHSILTFLMLRRHRDVEHVIVLVNTLLLDPTDFGLKPVRAFDNIYFDL